MSVGTPPTFRTISAPSMMILILVAAATVIANGGILPGCQCFAPSTTANRPSRSCHENRPRDKLSRRFRRPRICRRQIWSEQRLFSSAREYCQPEIAITNNYGTSINHTTMLGLSSMESFSVDADEPATKWNLFGYITNTSGYNLRVPGMALFRRQIVFPAWEDVIEFPASSIQASHEKYLRRHQIVKKRRVLKRTLSILTILGGEILRPLLCSLVRTASNVTAVRPTNLTHIQSIVPTDKDWDAFWRMRRVPGGPTNAERVARGVPALGPTFVKAAQIASTRPDVLPVPLADALGDLRDRVPPFDSVTAKRIIRTSIQRAMNHRDYSSPYIQTNEDLKDLMGSLTERPVAAASVAQVYKGTLPGFGPVAVKVLRPGIRGKVEKDATLFHSVATWVESWNNNTLRWFPLASSLPQDKPLGSLQLVQPVDEFTSRVLEDMDFVREVENMKVFSQLYDSRVGTSPTVKVVVPQPVAELCSERIIVMEWVEGTKLTDVVSSCRGDCGDNEQERIREENLKLIVQAIECTISQLLDHGLLHGDPHSANLLKVYTGNRNDNASKKRGRAQLGYLDFGLVSYVPQKFRDGIVCAVTQLIFARNIQAVADLCVDLELLPTETLERQEGRDEFIASLQGVLDEILIWPTDKKGISTAVPKLRFENLLPAVARLVRKYEFKVPPYFFQNIRALATLEGMGLALDPDFNVLRVVYPYSINRLMRNPSVSARVQETFLEICRSPHTTLLSPRRVRMLLSDWAMWTGYRKRKVFWDILTSAGGRRVAPVIFRNWLSNRGRNLQTLAQRFAAVARQILRRVRSPLFFLPDRRNGRVRLL